MSIDKLLKIKEIINEKAPKIDISNIYVFELDNIFYFVRMEIRNYEKKSIDKIKKYEYVDLYLEDNQNEYAFISPVYEVEPELLEYNNNEVPIYILKQIYDRLNNFKTKKKY